MDRAPAVGRIPLPLEQDLGVDIDVDVGDGHAVDGELGASPQELTVAIDAEEVLAGCHEQTTAQLVEVGEVAPEVDRRRFAIVERNDVEVLSEADRHVIGPDLGIVHVRGWGLGKGIDVDARPGR